MLFLLSSDFYQVLAGKPLYSDLGPNCKQRLSTEEKNWTPTGKDIHAELRVLIFILSLYLL